MITVLCVNIIYSAVIFMIWCGCEINNFQFESVSDYIKQTRLDGGNMVWMCL